MNCPFTIDFYSENHLFDEIFIKMNVGISKKNPDHMIRISLLI